MIPTTDFESTLVLFKGEYNVSPAHIKEAAISLDIASGTLQTNR